MTSAERASAKSRRWEWLAAGRPGLHGVGRGSDGAGLSGLWRLGQGFGVDRLRISNRALLFGTVVVQLLCVFYIVSDVVLGLFGLPPLNWTFRELIEIFAAVGLFLGLAATTLLIRRTTRRSDAVEGQLRAASGAFMELLHEKFADWRLTPAERDVALFVIKGLSTADIAALRDTSEGTVKAQTNAIYRKAGVTGRTQLLSLFIEDLIAGPVLPKDPSA